MTVPGLTATCGGFAMYSKSPEPGLARLSLGDSGPESPSDRDSHAANSSAADGTSIRKKTVVDRRMDPPKTKRRRPPAGKMQRQGQPTARPAEKRAANRDTAEPRVRGRANGRDEGAGGARAPRRCDSGGEQAAKEAE